MKDEHAVLRLCQELEVSASGYYEWQSRRRCPGPRVLQDQALKQQIQSIHTKVDPILWTTKRRN